MLVKTVSMSSRDPPWMTPLLKSMIRTKSRVSRLSKDRLCVVNKRIADIISENRRKFMDAPPGSRAWWKGVDELSQRRRASCKVNLDNSCLMDLNDYFARLCSDDMYIEPTRLDPTRFLTWFGKSMQRFSRLLSPKSGISQSLLSAFHHRGNVRSSPPSPKWMFLKHLVIIAALI